MAIATKELRADKQDSQELDDIYETTICQLEPNQTGIVIRIQGESTLRSHLLEMGFTRGTHIEFVRRAPLGDPIDVILRGYRLSLREREACSVVVRTQPLAGKAGDRFRATIAANLEK
jgi:Fe2+ transport system protein FeoA